MNYFLIILLNFAFFQVPNCILAPKWKENTLAEAISKSYGKIALDEINKYRKLNFFLKKMEWQDTLADQAENEAREVLHKQNFGDHDRFEEYEKNPDQEYFTEIAVKLTLNDHGKPTKRTLGQYILTALTKDYKSYIAQDYTYAGIAVLPYSNNPNEYLVILHLAQKNNKWSCQKALDSGHMAKSITITRKGKEETLLCDQETDGGGWTLIADKEEYGRGIRVIVPIDDRGLDYTQIMWEAKPDFYFNYVNGARNHWDYDQYNFRQCGLRFGDRWYVDKRHQGYNVKYYTYDRTQDIKILKQGNKCFWGTSQVNYMCASKFIFKTIPRSQRVNAFSEMESAAGVAYTDNIYRFNFKLYVRG